MGANMMAGISLKKIAAGLLVVAGILYAPHFSAAQSATPSPPPAASAAGASLDYQFFKTRVEPIFLKKRPGHARCYVCHSGRGEGGAPAYLEKLSPGSATWDEEQSLRIFKRVSGFVVPGNPAESPLVMHPLAPEAGGDYSNRMHGGGRQFASQDDPDWKTIAAWVRGEK
jgi:hypothetical protein